MRGARDSESRAPAAFVSTRHSVVAGVGRRICLVVGAIQAVIVKTAASEMAPSTAKVLPAHARHVAAAETAEVASAKAADVASVKTTDVAAAKAAAHVTSATTVSSATAAAGLGISGKKAAGKHCTCQNHHHSSSHDILHLGWAGPPATGSRWWRVPKANANVAMEWRWRRLLARSTKFRFNHRPSLCGSNQGKAPPDQQLDIDHGLAQEPTRKPALLDPGEPMTRAKPCFQHHRR